MPYRGSDASEVKFVGTGSTSFDGSNDYVDTNSTFQSTFQGSFTISAWIKPTDGNPSADEIYIGTNNADDTDAMYLYVRDGGELGFYYETNNNGDLTLTNSVLFTDGQQDWCHVCAVVDDTLNQVSLYFNGVSQTLSGSYDGDISSITNSDFQSSGTTPNLFIGAYSDNGTSSQEYKGSMKNVAIWSRALTATEVQNVMYKSYVNVSGRLASGLVSWWAMDADSIGAEKFTDSAMSGSGWTLETTWAFSGTSLRAVDCGNGQNAYLSNATVNGQYYRLSFTISDYTTGGVSLFAESHGTTYNSVGDHYYDFYSSGTSVLVGFKSVGTTTLDITDVSLKAISVEDLKGSNDGEIVGATVDEDLYGGDTPVIPRGIDNARTVQADAIGAGSASFDGTDDYISTGYDNSGAPIDVTYSFWAKSTTTGQNQGVFGHGGEAIGGFHFNFGGSAPSLLYLGTNLFRFFVDHVAQDDGKWHHWAIKVDGDDITNCEVFVDGTSLAVSSTTSSGSTYNSYTKGLQIGTDGDTSYFEGNICQFGVWEALLTQAQIQSIMEKTFEELTASEKTNLVSYWALDETIESSGSGASVVYDKVDTTLGSDVITNGSMESDSDWTNTGSPTTNEQSATQKYSGSYSRRMVTAGSGWTGIRQTGISVTQGAVYKLTYYIYGVSGSYVYIGFYSTGGWATKADASAFENSSETYTNGSWTEKIIYFKPTGTGDVTDGQLQFRRLASVVEVYIDNVSLEKIGGNHGVLV
jgi:hypothetical protein